MSSISNVGLLTAFAAGAISFLSPCVLPLVPGYISYVSGSTLDDTQGSSNSRFSALFLSACFVAGFSSIFVALGASATAISQALLSWRYEATLIGGAIIVLFGVFMTGLIPMPWLHRELRFHGDVRPGGPLGAYVLGLAFGFGWTPCIGPVLGAILTLSAVSATASAGIALLTAYSIGLGMPFMLTAAFTGTLLHRLRGIRRAGRILHIGAGGVMVVMGIAMATGIMSAFSFWLLENVPLLARIG